MTDLVFKQGINTTFGSSTLNLTAPNELRESVPTGNYQVRDVVRIRYTDSFQKSVYAVCTNATGAATFSFDSDIYPIGLSSITTIETQVYNTADVIGTDVYRLGVDVENGLYSKAYKKYSSNISYRLIIPISKREYFGSSSLVVNSSDVVFADYCENKAYGVGLSEISLDNLNNKFKSQLEFNIATR